MEDFPNLEKNTVCVWRLVIPDLPRDRRGAAESFLEIQDPPPRLERHAAWLTPAERERAGRFYFDADRRRFAWTRGVLKVLLAYYAETSPDRIHFDTAAKGKLSLHPGTHPACRWLRFNVSHSHERSLIALTRDREVGVDVEQHRPLRHELFGIADRFFAPAEVAALRALPASAQEAGFFRIWSRKEAYIKATGEGVSAGLDTFEVSIGPEAAVTLRVYDRPDEDRRWTMRSLDAGAGYGAALCVEGRESEIDLQLRDW
jgi:4'-phosphopantetheinyl transferase